MAKDRSFSGKTAKVAKGGAAAHAKICPVCGEPIVTLKHISLVPNEEKKSMRFNDKFIGVCKCNTANILG
jgi:hypothetical protein